MLIHPYPYAEMPKQPWNTILAGVNPFTSKGSMRQPKLPDNPEGKVYGLLA